MSIRSGSRPKWLYWPKGGYGQFHITRLRLHIAFAGKSKRRSDDFAGSTSRQRSAAHDLALHQHAVYAQYAVFAPAESAAFVLSRFAVLALHRHAVYAQYAVFASAEFAAFALAGFAALALGVIVLGPPSVNRQRLPLCIGIGGRSPSRISIALESSEQRKYR
jgi:hypothetical protein